LDLDLAGDTEHSEAPRLGDYDDVDDRSHDFLSQTEVAQSNMTVVIGAPEAQAAGRGSQGLGCDDTGNSDRQRPRHSDNDSSRNAMSQAELTPLRGFGRGSPTFTPPAGLARPSGSAGSAGRGRARVFSGNQIDAQPASHSNTTSPVLTRSRSQVGGTGRRPGELSRGWNDIFNQDRYRSGATKSAAKTKAK
jgi:hypothetical protein